MSERDRAARYEELESAVWRSGYRGEGPALDAVLDALQGYVLALVDDRAEALSAEAAQEQTAEIDDLQRQITELRGAPGSPEPPVDMAALVGELGARVEASEKAYWDAARAWEEQRRRGAILPTQDVPEAAYEDFAAQLDAIESDPYGDALLAALEEAAQEGYDPDADDGEEDPYASMTRAELIDALKRAVAENPGVVLTGAAGPWPRPCRTCGELLGPESFKKDRAMADGYRTDCKPCVRKRDKARAARKAQETPSA